MNTSYQHEEPSKFLGRLIYVLTEELGLPVISGGSTTLKRQKSSAAWNRMRLDRTRAGHVRQEKPRLAHLRHLKQTMKMDVLHCTTVDGVRKELTMFALVYNLVGAVMHAAAVRQGVPVERIGFADALG